MEYLRFIKKKISNLPIGILIRLEFESLFFGLISLFPTTFGIIMRAILAKLFFKKITGFAFIQPRVTIIHSEKILAGKHLGINSGTYLNAIGGIEFGDNVLIGSNVTISSGEHPINGNFPAVFERPTIPKKIIFGNDVWIGAGVVIVPGIKIADGTVIGSNAVVTHDTEPYGVYVGVPARKIKTRI